MKAFAFFFGAAARASTALLRDREGSALIEGAIVVPVLMTLLFGVFEFSFLFFQQQMITSGVRDAARYVARYNFSSCATLDSTCTMLSTAITNAKCLATTGTVDCTGSARVSGWTSTAITIANPTSVANTGASTPCGSSPCNSPYGAVVYTVTVSTSFVDPSLGLFGFLGLTAPTIAVSHTERVVGFG